jgi:hypothetical protein
VKAGTAGKRVHRTCFGCNELRYGIGWTSDPHAELKLLWKDPETAQAFVYYCNDCRTVLMRNIGGSGREWK